MFHRIGFFLVLLACACSLPSNAQTLVTDIPISGFPYGVAVNPSLNRIYVALNSQSTAAVVVIDGATNTVIDTIPTPRGAAELAVNVATARVYSGGCTSTSCSVTVIDGNTNAVLGSIPINASPGIGVQGIAVNPVTNTIYVSDDNDVKVDVIDGYSNKIVTSVSFAGAQPLGIAVDFGTNQYAVAIDGPYVYIVSGATNKIVKRLTVGSFATNIAINSFTSQAYVTNETFAPSTVSVVNLRNYQIEASIPVGNNPFGVCVDLYTNLAFVTNTQDGTVAMVNGNTNTKTGSVNAQSFLVDVNPVTRLLYATDNIDSVVHVISE
jgi:YVTN family beta-propeller protein